jgi:hypothetical protein
VAGCCHVTALLARRSIVLNPAARASSDATTSQQAEQSIRVPSQ